MRLQSPEDTPGVLPLHIERIIVLRTAQLREVDWALAELAALYPDAAVAVLGTKLKALGAFEGYEQIEIDGDWLTRDSVRPHAEQIRQFNPDLAVMCLNNDWFVGYERASQVMRRLPGRHKLVATCNRRWRRWRHLDFVDGPVLLRWLVNGLLLVLYPLVAVYLLIRPSRPRYRPSPRSGPAPKVKA